MFTSTGAPLRDRCKNPHPPQGKMYKRTINLLASSESFPFSSHVPSISQEKPISNEYTN